MASGLSTHQAIVQVKTQSGNDPLKLSFPEKSGQTAAIVFPGVPLQLTTGYAAIWDGTTKTAGILGIASGYGQNLLSDGLGAPVPPFGPVTGAKAIQTWGTVPNQPSAVNIAPGTPMATGRQEAVQLAVRDTWFEAQIDNSSTGVAVTARTLVGVAYGLTVDANNTWYVDLFKTGADAVLVIEQLNPTQAIGTSFGKVWFSFLSSAYQLGA